MLISLIEEIKVIMEKEESSDILMLSPLRMRDEGKSYVGQYSIDYDIKCG